MSNALTPIQRIKQDEEEGKCISNKQDKSPEGDPNEMEMYCLPDREFKITIIKMLTKVRRTMHRESKNFNKEITKTYYQKKRHKPTIRTSNILP